MTGINNANFGHLIAFLTPGITVLWGASYHSSTIRVWLTTGSTDQPTIAGFLYMTIAAVAAGLSVSTVRWAIIDPLHHATGIGKPRWDFGKLQKNLAAYLLVEQNHYKFYLFYANMVIALQFLVLARIFAGEGSGLDALLLTLSVVFYAGSRDTLRKYYDRVSIIMR